MDAYPGANAPVMHATRHITATSCAAALVIFALADWIARGNQTANG